MLTPWGASQPFCWLRFDLEESQCEVTSGTTLPPWWKHSCLVDGPLQIDGLDGEEGGGAAGLDHEVDVVLPSGG